MNVNETIDEWNNVRNIKNNYTFDGIDQDDKNRYPDILPYSFNSVKLNNYINASWINIGDKDVIVCQSPLPNTFYDFWDMVLKYDITKIFMLTDFKENGVIKAHKYWPSTSLPQSICDIQIENLGDNNINDDITKTNILVKREDKEMCVTHIHYTGWSDHKPPSIIEDIKTLSDMYTEKDENCIIHCSAGCGRSGTFCGILRYINTKETAISILNNLRRQRVYMINNIYQYAFLKNYILNFN